MLNLANIFGQSFDDGMRHGTGDECDASWRGHGFWEPAFRACPLIDEVARHADTVLDLRIGAVVIGGWEFALREVVPFVREINERITSGIIGLKFALVYLYLLDNCFGFFLCVVAQRW